MEFILALLLTLNAFADSAFTPYQKIQSIGSVDSQTKQSAVLAISNGVLAIQSADSSNAGIVSTAVQTLAGAKNFSGGISTNAISNLTSNGFVTTNSANGSLGVQSFPISQVQGGTGNTAYTDGQLLIGNTSTGGLTKATLTQGANVTITNANGSITIAAASGSTPVITTKTTDYTVSTSDSGILCNGTLTLTLPAATNYMELLVVNIGTGTCTINPNGSDTINGASNLVLTSGQYVAIGLISNGGSQWFVY